MNRPLTPAVLDRILDGKNIGGRASPNVPSLATESLWGVKSIAAFLNRSPDTIRRMAKRDPTFPVRTRGGTLFVTRTEIVVWLQRRHDEVRQSD